MLAGWRAGRGGGGQVLGWCLGRLRAAGLCRGGGWRAGRSQGGRCVCVWSCGPPLVMAACGCGPKNLAAEAAPTRRLGGRARGFRRSYKGAIGYAPARQILENDALPRSEEHTSELQSLMRNSSAVLCLKKKKQKIRQHY